MAPINDDFADAIELSGDSGLLEFTTLGWTTEADEDTNGQIDVQGQGSVWFKWTAREDGLMQLSTNQTPMPLWDSFIGVCTGTDLTDLKRWASDDDSGLQAGTPADPGFGTSWVWWQAYKGVSYWIVISAYEEDAIGPGQRDGCILTWEFTEARETHIYGTYPIISVNFPSSYSSAFGGAGQYDMSVLRTDDGDSSYFDVVQTNSIQDSGGPAASSVPGRLLTGNDHFISAELRMVAKNLGVGTQSWTGNIYMAADSAGHNLGYLEPWPSSDGVGGDSIAWLIPPADAYAEYSWRWYRNTQFTSSALPTNFVSIEAWQQDAINTGRIGWTIEDVYDGNADIHLRVTQVEIVFRTYQTPVAPPTPYSAPALNGSVRRTDRYFSKGRN